MCFFQQFTTIPVFYREDFHLSVFFIGLIMAANGLLIALFEMVIIFKLEGRRPHLHFISTGVLLTGISYLLLDVSFINDTLLAVISMVIVTVGEILSMPFMNSYWITRTQSHNRGQYAALITVAWALAQTVGPFIGSVIAENWGFKILWIVVGVTCVLLAFLYKWLQAKKT
jgi:predicted MFS family arabinose efflux permease